MDDSSSRQTPTLLGSFHIYDVSVLSNGIVKPKLTCRFRFLERTLIPIVQDSAASPSASVISFPPIRFSFEDVPESRIYIDIIKLKFLKQSNIKAICSSEQVFSELIESHVPSETTSLNDFFVFEPKAGYQIKFKAFVHFPQLWLDQYKQKKTQPKRLKELIQLANSFVASKNQNSRIIDYLSYSPLMDTIIKQTCMLISYPSKVKKVEPQLSSFWRALDVIQLKNQIVRTHPDMLLVLSEALLKDKLSHVTHIQLILAILKSFAVSTAASKMLLNLLDFFEISVKSMQLSPSSSIDKVILAVIEIICYYDPKYIPHIVTKLVATLRCLFELRTQLSRSTLTRALAILKWIGLPHKQLIQENNIFRYVSDITFTSPGDTLSLEAMDVLSKFGIGDSASSITALIQSITHAQNFNILLNILDSIQSIVDNQIIPPLECSKLISALFEQLSSNNQEFIVYKIRSILDKLKIDPRIGLDAKLYHYCSKFIDTQSKSSDVAFNKVFQFIAQVWHQMTQTIAYDGLEGVYGIIDTVKINSEQQNMIFEEHENQIIQSGLFESATNYFNTPHLERAKIEGYALSYLLLILRISPRVRNHVFQNTSFVAKFPSFLIKFDEVDSPLYMLTLIRNISQWVLLLINHMKNGSDTQKLEQIVDSTSTEKQSSQDSKTENLEESIRKTLVIFRNMSNSGVLRSKPYNHLLPDLDDDPEDLESNKFSLRYEFSAVWKNIIYFSTQYLPSLTPELLESSIIIIEPEKLLIFCLSFYNWILSFEKDSGFSPTTTATITTAATSSTTTASSTLVTTKDSIQNTISPASAFFANKSIIFKHIFSALLPSSSVLISLLQNDTRKSKTPNHLPKLIKASVICQIMKLSICYMDSAIQQESIQKEGPNGEPAIPEIIGYSLINPIPKEAESCSKVLELQQACIVSMKHREAQLDKQDEKEEQKQDEKQQNEEIRSPEWFTIQQPTDVTITYSNDPEMESLIYENEESIKDFKIWMKEFDQILQQRTLYTRALFSNLQDSSMSNHKSIGFLRSFFAEKTIYDQYMDKFDELLAKSPGLRKSIFKRLAISRYTYFNDVRAQLTSHNDLLCYKFVLFMRKNLPNILRYWKSNPEAKFEVFPLIHCLFKTANTLFHRAGVDHDLNVIHRSYQFPTTLHDVDYEAKYLLLEEVLDTVCSMEVDLEEFKSTTTAIDHHPEHRLQLMLTSPNHAMILNWIVHILWKACFGPIDRICEKAFVQLPKWLEICSNYPSIYPQIFSPLPANDLTHLLARFYHLPQATADYMNAMRKVFLADKTRFFTNINTWYNPTVTILNRLLYNDFKLILTRFEQFEWILGRTKSNPFDPTWKLGLPLEQQDLHPDLIRSLKRQFKDEHLDYHSFLERKKAENKEEAHQESFQESVKTIDDQNYFNEYASMRINLFNEAVLKQRPWPSVELNPFSTIDHVCRFIGLNEFVDTMAHPSKWGRKIPLRIDLPSELPSEPLELEKLKLKVIEQLGTLVRACWGMLQVDEFAVCRISATSLVELKELPNSSNSKLKPKQSAARAEKQSNTETNFDIIMNKYYERPDMLTNQNTGRIVSKGPKKAYYAGGTAFWSYIGYLPFIPSEIMNWEFLLTCSRLKHMIPYVFNSLLGNLLATMLESKLTIYQKTSSSNSKLEPSALLDIFGSEYKEHLLSSFVSFHQYIPPKKLKAIQKQLKRLVQVSTSEKSSTIHIHVFFAPILKEISEIIHSMVVYRRRCDKFKSRNAKAAQHNQTSSSSSSSSSSSPSVNNDSIDQAQIQSSAINDVPIENKAEEGPPLDRTDAIRLNSLLLMLNELCFGYHHEFVSEVLIFAREFAQLIEDNLEIIIDTFSTASHYTEIPNLIRTFSLTLCQFVTSDPDKVRSLIAEDEILCKFVTNFIWIAKYLKTQKGLIMMLQRYGQFLIKNREEHLSLWKQISAAAFALLTGNRTKYSLDAFVPIFFSILDSDNPEDEAWRTKVLSQSRMFVPPQDVPVFFVSKLLDSHDEAFTNFLVYKWSPVISRLWNTHNADIDYTLPMLHWVAKHFLNYTDDISCSASISEIASSSATSETRVQEYSSTAENNRDSKHPTFKKSKSKLLSDFSSTNASQTGHLISAFTTHLLYFIGEYSSIRTIDYTAIAPIFTKQLVPISVHIPKVLPTAPSDPIDNNSIKRDFSNLVSQIDEYCERLSYLKSAIFRSNSPIHAIGTMVSVPVSSAVTHVWMLLPSLTDNVPNDQPSSSSAVIGPPSKKKPKANKLIYRIDDEIADYIQQESAPPYAVAASLYRSAPNQASIPLKEICNNLCYDTSEWVYTLPKKLFGYELDVPVIKLMKDPAIRLGWATMNALEVLKQNPSLAVGDVPGSFAWCNRTGSLFSGGSVRYLLDRRNNYISFNLKTSPPSKPKSYLDFELNCIIFEGAWTTLDNIQKADAVRLHLRIPLPKKYLKTTKEYAEGKNVDPSDPYLLYPCLSFFGSRKVIISPII